MFQKCPVCLGSGNNESPSFGGMNIVSTCRVCEGSGIIHETTGMPGPKRNTAPAPIYIPKGSEVAEELRKELVDFNRSSRYNHINCSCPLCMPYKPR